MNNTTPAGWTVVYYTTPTAMHANTWLLVMVCVLITVGYMAHLGKRPR